jgi:predicted Zn-dependent protease
MRTDWDGYYLDGRTAARKRAAVSLAAGIDPAGMIAFFEKLEEEYGNLPGGFSYFSTHPRTADRIAFLRKRASASGRTFTPLLDDATLTPTVTPR